MALFGLGDLATPPTEAPPSDSKRKGSGVEVKEKRITTALAKAADKLAQAIPAIEKGQSIHFATAGDWSAHDMVLHIARQIGPAHLIGSTWSITEPACRQLVRALHDGRLLSVSLLLDWRVRERCPEALQLAEANAARLRLVNSHAKVSVLHNDEWQVVIVGSANYTKNPRIEAGVISTQPEAVEFHRNWLELEIENAKPFEDMK